MAATGLRTCAVIGGAGSVGRSLVHRLLRLGGWVVRIADSTECPELDLGGRNSLLRDAFSSGCASFVRVDVRSKCQIMEAIAGSTVVFCIGCATSSRHDFYTCYTFIVQGAKNVINACRECKVKRLIYNSSADVVSEGLHDVCNGDESMPYARKFENMLNDLKAQAEAVVLFANDIDGLLTCALRPSNVFGPGDMEIIPLLVKGAKFGWAKFILGSGENKSDFTFVENVAHALICADEALGSQTVSVGGKAFFITNFEPVKFWEFMSRILEGLGYQRPIIKIPGSLAWNLVLLIKWIYAKLDSTKSNQCAALYDFVELALCTRTFNCSAADKQIGYSPVVSLEEGVALTIESFSHLARDRTYLKRDDLDGPSNVEKLLGGGKIADVLLWREEKKTFACFLALVTVCYWFLTSDGTFISSVAKLFLLVTAMLLGYGFLLPNMFGFNLQTIPSCYEISESDMLDFVTSIAYMWNRVVSVPRTLAQGEDWNLFLKATFSIYISKFILSNCLMAANVGIVLAFTLFFVYDQYEEETDEIVKFLYGITKDALGLLKKNLLVFLPSYLRNYEMPVRDKRPAVE